MTRNWSPPKVPGFITGDQLVRNKYIWNVVRKRDKVAGVLKGVPISEKSRRNPHRIKDEIAIIRQLTQDKAPGILPMLKAESGPDPFWYITPKAELLAVYLKDKDFHTVVEIVAELAECLRFLNEKYGVHHRDIKPDNLFWLKGKPVFGDFEIARWAKKKTFATRTRQRVGPEAYLAPEAGRAGNVDDWGKVDVYSLAKTLWSLAAPRESDGSVRRPPPGEHQGLYPAYGLQYLTDRRASSLNGLMESASAHDPRERPSVDVFASELRAWLANNEQISDPSPVSKGKVGFGYLIVSGDRYDRAATHLVVAITHEANEILGTVFMDTAALEMRVAGVLDPFTGAYRSEAVMTIVPRYEDEDLSDITAFALYSEDRNFRIVVGGSVTSPDDKSPLFVEVQRQSSDATWGLIYENTFSVESIRWPSSRVALREELVHCKKACVDAGLEDASVWTGFRVM